MKFNSYHFLREKKKKESNIKFFVLLLFLYYFHLIKLASLSLIIVGKLFLFVSFFVNDSSDLLQRHEKHDVEGYYPVRVRCEPIIKGQWSLW